MDQLDRLEAAMAAKDAELRRMKTELELRALYARELLAAIEKQALRLEQLDERLSLMEQFKRPPIDVKKHKLVTKR